MTLNWYCSREAVKSALGEGSTDTADHAEIDLAIEAVSREIDRECGRHFYPATRTLYFTSRESNCLLLPVDLLAVTTLKTDPNGDRTYSDTWTTSDYDLEPVNAPYESVPGPYWEIRNRWDGDYSFPTNPRGVQIVGSFGYYNVRKTPASTLNEALDASEVGVDVTSGTLFEVGQTILIDSEQMWISAISTNTLTVTRGVNGTTAATHDTAAVIQTYEYPLIGDAAKIQAVLLFKSKDAPGGVLGEGGFVRQSIVQAGLHPHVRNMVASLKHIPVGGRRY